MIEIQSYDPNWAREFEAERARILSALGDIVARIDHVGSTSVPGLAAKPVIDIQISVAGLHPLDPYRTQLEGLGYRHRPHADDAFCPYFYRPAEKPHTHHIHVVEAGGAEERRTLAFRDYLRAHPAAAREYEALKRRLAEQFSDAGSHEEYATAKGTFVERMIDAATVEAHYGRFAEEDRLTLGPSQLEFERTKEILARLLPPPPARVMDVGGAAGVYSLWLAEAGYEVHLIDASPRLIEEARRRSERSATPIASLTVGDARQLPYDDGMAAGVLLMGPLYHLTVADDRIAALREARRVLAPDGVVAAAAISRYASALDGLASKRAIDPRFVAIRNRDLADGQHRNDTDNPDYFTTAYFHRSEDLQAELLAAGFDNPCVLGVEGPAWLLSDFEARWDDPVLRKDILEVARALEAAPSALGVSAHLLGIGHKTPIGTA
jgi:GrpB-like predicted nucleotidyltransferase (UPF0157 family)/ubiquinone/menaquinone biosynthesis C-methylase UbiE